MKLKITLHLFSKIVNSFLLFYYECSFKNQSLRIWPCSFQSLVIGTFNLFLVSLVCVFLMFLLLSLVFSFSVNLPFRCYYKGAIITILYEDSTIENHSESRKNQRSISVVKELCLQRMSWSHTFEKGCLIPKSLCLSLPHYLFLSLSLSKKHRIRVFTEK